MVFERKIVVGLADITGIILECGKCKARVLLNPDQKKFPSRCPQCPTNWIPQNPTNYTSVDSPHANLLNGIADLRNLLNLASPNVLIFLEFDESKNDTALSRPHNSTT